MLESVYGCHEYRSNMLCLHVLDSEFQIWNDVQTLNMLWTYLSVSLNMLQSQVCLTRESYITSWFLTLDDPKRRTPWFIPMDDGKTSYFPGFKLLYTGYLSISGLQKHPYINIQVGNTYLNGVLRGWPCLALVLPSRAKPLSLLCLIFLGDKWYLHVLLLFTQLGKGWMLTMV